jgi:hypothetical protein
LSTSLPTVLLWRRRFEQQGLAGIGRTAVKAIERRI